MTGEDGAPDACSAGVLGRSLDVAASASPRAPAASSSPTRRLRGWPRRTPRPCSRAASPERRAARSARSRDDRAMRFGVYVHIPFCASPLRLLRLRDLDRPRPPDRATTSTRASARRRAAGRGRRAAARDVACSSAAGRRRCSPARDLARRSSTRSRGHASAEVTVECNPDSVDRAKLDGYRAAGVTRLSFGVQSMQPHVLAALGRTHDPGRRDACRRAARATSGFETFNVDVIYGAPGESLDDWRAHARRASLALEPAHVSAYALTVEPATPLGRRVAAGATRARRRRPGDEVRARRRRALRRPGSTGTRSRTGPVPATSAGTTSSTGTRATTSRSGARRTATARRRRWWNVRTPERYIDRVAAGLDPRVGSRDARRSGAGGGGARARAAHRPRARCRRATAVDEADAARGRGLARTRVGSRAVLTRARSAPRLRGHRPAGASRRVAPVAVAAARVGTR